MPNPEMKTLTIGNNTFNIRDPSKLPLAGGTMTGAVAMGANKITGLAAGTSDTDAINKKQLDDAIAGIGTVTEVTISTAGAVSQALDAGKIYHFTGALTSLTITLNAASGLAHYHFDFDCGSTAPTVTIPNTVTMPSGNSFDASKHYEVDILNNYGAVLSWANS